MAFKRASGVLLHPTSLPGRHGIGDLGEAAYIFIDFLVASKQSIWQVLPLGPTGYGDSPYQCFSAFAGNPMLINLDRLVEEGLLTANDVVPDTAFSHERVNFGPVIAYKTERLKRAYEKFKADGHRVRRMYDEFIQREASWLNDYALFMALKLDYGGGPWVEWPTELVRREPDALEVAQTRLADSIGYQKFIQWLFFEQWHDVKHAANSKGIQIVGDVPIFVAHDSADAWANPHLFYLDEDGQPTVVAGVPPDYFSATGQRWGNPLYRWDIMAQDGYDWWIRRMKATLNLVDIIRIDHFRGFEAYWEIPATEPTAVKGRWIDGPKAHFFEAVKNALGGQVPVMAENLGVITPGVENLRKQFDMPGMRIVQFGFGSGPDNNFLPHNYDNNTVVYTGTHDNETIMGWYLRKDTTGTTDDPETVKRERLFATRYANIKDPADAHWDFIRLAWMSVADLALVPMQDILGLGNEARMNYPSSESGNWQWRYTPEQLKVEHAERLAELTHMYSRD